MGYAVKQSSTTVPFVFGPIVLSSDHVSNATGKTLTVVISKDGASFGSPSGSVSEIGNGYYQIAANATDNGTVGPLVIYATGTGCDPFSDTFAVVTYDPFSAANGLLIAGSNAPTTFAGSSSTAGLTITGGATAAGALVLTGGSTSGAGLSVTTTSGDGLSITPTAGHALTLTGNGTTKHGINATGGSTSSDGIRATGGGTGNGINAQSGTGASGDGIKGVANSTNGNGLNLAGNGSAHGANITAGATGNGMNVNAGSSSGVGINVSATSGHGIETVGGGTGHGILAGSGPGATGDGILAVANSTNGNGVTFTHAGTGKDLNATTTPLTLAKTTNITGFNDIAATAVVSSGAISTSGGKVSEVALVDTLTTYTGNTVQTGDAYARLGAPAGASVSADVASVKTDTGMTIPGRLPSALTGAGNLKADAVAIGGDTSCPAHLVALGLSYVLGSVNDSSPTTGGFVGSSGLSTTVGDYNRAFLVFTSGANQGIGRAISGYTGSTTKTFSFTGGTGSSDAPFPVAPTNTDSFLIIGRAANGT